MGDEPTLQLPSDKRFRRFCALGRLEYDLIDVHRLCYMMASSSIDRESKDAYTMMDAVLTTALVRYARCFDAGGDQGKDRTTIPESVFGHLAPELQQWHRRFLRLRHLLSAHYSWVTVDPVVLVHVIDKEGGLQMGRLEPSIIHLLGLGKDEAAKLAFLCNQAQQRWVQPQLQDEHMKLRKIVEGTWKLEDLPVFDGLKDWTMRWEDVDRDIEQDRSQPSRGRTKRKRCR